MEEENRVEEQSSEEVQNGEENSNIEEQSSEEVQNGEENSNIEEQPQEEVQNNEENNHVEEQSQEEIQNSEENSNVEEKAQKEEQNSEGKNDAVEQKNESNGKKEKEKEKKSDWKKRVLIILAIIIIILLLLRFCGRRYKITIHNGDDIIEVDENFKLSDFDAEGGKVTFLVDSDGHIVNPEKTLTPGKEYSTHIVPEGKETVKVKYINGKKELEITYQKGAGLLFPSNPKKKGYVFIGWKDKETGKYPAMMTPVLKDMVLIAQFAKTETSNDNGKNGSNGNNDDSGKKGEFCIANCDTNSDGKCDTNCDTDGDGKPDSNLDTDKDGNCDKNCDTNGDEKCDLNCDTNGDNTCDLNCDHNGDGEPDYNLDTDDDGKCDLNCDTNHDGACDNNCIQDSDNDIEHAINTYYNNGKTYFYDCDDGHGIIVTVTKEQFISATLNGKKVEPKNYVYGYASFDLSEYRGSGKTIELKIKLILTDNTKQKYYLIHTITLEFADNCGKSNGNENNNNNNNNTNNNTSTEEPSTDKPSDNVNQGAVSNTEKDNGTVSIQMPNYCLVSGHRLNVTAVVNNAKDSYIDWLGDTCLSIAGEGDTVTVIGNGCGPNPTITARLHNGASDTATLTYEDTLSFTVTNRYGTALSPYKNENGVVYYEGNDLTISTNVSAYISGSGVTGDSGSSRTSASIPGATTTDITITTPCGQSKSIHINAIIN